MERAVRGTFRSRFICPQSTSASRGLSGIAALLCAFPASVAHAQSAAPPADASLPSVWSAPEPWRTDRFFFVTSAKTWHFSYDPAHVDKQDLVLIEWNVTETWLVGASSFKNSFGQPSQFVYGGYRWRPFDAAQPLYFKLAVGLVHGYSGQYQNKIPFNNSGVAPAIVPSVGYCINRFCSELVLFGGAGAMINVGVTIP